MGERKNAVAASQVFSLTLKKLRKSRNLTQEELGNALKVKKSCISNYEKGVSMPDISRLIEIANFFHVQNIGQLLGYTQTNSVKEDEQDNRFVPIVGVIEYEKDPVYPGNIVDDMTLPNSNLHTGEFFGFNMHDNSMDRSGIKKGVTLVFSKTSLVSTGDIVLIAKENEPPYIRRIYVMEDGSIALQPDSSDKSYLPVILSPDRDNYNIVGRLAYIYTTKEAL